MTPHSTVSIPTGAAAIDESVRFLRGLCTRPPSVGMITGSGFQYVPERGVVNHRIPFSELPGLQTSTVQGHASEVVLFEEYGHSCIGLSGRIHAYEGHSTEECFRSVSLLHNLGVRSLIITNAAGGVQKHIRTGDVALISDTIDFTFKPQLLMSNLDAWYGSKQFINNIERSCLKAGVPLRHVTYCQVLGPSYETRAEVRMLRKIGADVVGMSTVRELRYAQALGMSVAGFSLITNSHNDAKAQTVSHDEVLDVAAKAQSMMKSIVSLAISCVTD